MSAFIDLEAWQGLDQPYRHGRHAVFVAQRGQQHPQALLLLHGFPTASWDWHKQWPALTARWHCLAPDLLGFGYSAKPRRYRYSIMDQADMVQGLLADRNIQRYHLLAHDYGDTVAQELLARDQEERRKGAPGSIRSLCLLNGGIFPEVHQARPVQHLLAGPLGWLVVKLLSERAFAQNMRQVFGPRTPPAQAELDAFWRLSRHNGGTGIYHKLIRYMQERREHRDRWVNALVGADIPLRFINGVQDPVSGLHMLERYRELIDKPDTLALDCGHYPQIEEAQECLDGIVDFFNAVEGAI